MEASREVHHSRDESFYVAFSPVEVAQVAKEIADETVAPVTLSLFIFWVREKSENYEEAKSHIRQLSLDKGYNTSRIANEHLRKLLDECLDMRPNRPVPRVKMLTSSGANSPASSTFGTPSSKESIKSPVQMLVRENSSPWSSKYEKSPPNTPDRPAPLVIKSRSSSLASPTPKTALFRSVSTPVRMREASGSSTTSKLPHMALPPTVLEATAELARMSWEEEDDDNESTGLYSDDDELEDYCSRLFDGTHNLRALLQRPEEEIDAIILAQNTSPGPKSTNTQLETAQDAATVIGSPKGSDLAASTKSSFRQSTSSPQRSISDPFRAADISSIDFDALPDGSPIPAPGTSVHVRYAGNRVPPPSFKPAPAPTPAQRREAAEARRREQTELTLSLNNAGSMTRPLPFRGIGTSAHDTDSLSKEPTNTDIKNRPKPDRSSKSSSSLVASSPSRSLSTSSPRHSLSAMSPNRSLSARSPSRRYNAPSLNSTSSSSLTRTYSLYPSGNNSPTPAYHGHLLRSATQPGPARAGNELKIEGVEEFTRRVGHNALKPRSVTQRLEQVSTRVARMKASLKNGSGSGSGNENTDETPTTPNNTPSQANNNVKPLVDEPLTRATALQKAYTRVTYALMSSALEKARVGAENLPAVCEENLSAKERVWRRENEELIVSVYGRADVVLTGAEMRFLDEVRRVEEMINLDE